MDTPKAFIESIRREKFSIGVGRNQLAPDLDRAIRQLSVGLYQHDFHFIKELIQNAEDNAYEENVCPSLEFKLIQNDIARVGASATLLILNNERGLTRADVTALCSVGDSTKVGRRNEGFIGCKGVGFKSIFMICETAIIISNGYRIKFRQTASKDAGVGYIVPEWTEFPTDRRIQLACGSRSKLPTTIIILPIREGKVDLVRQQLKELSPEMILFLTRIRELIVADDTKDAANSVGFLKITRSEPISGITSDVCKFFEVTLGAERTSPCSDLEIHSYIIFQQSHPVTHPIKERKEMTGLTGFPFIIHADFLLTTSRESIRFDSPWKLGILDCIPANYELAFKILVRKAPQEVALLSTKLLNSKDAYQFLPYNTVDNAYRYNSAGRGENRQQRQKLCVGPQQSANLDYLEQVRTKIFQRLQKHCLVRTSMDIGNGCTVIRNAVAKACRQVMPMFLDILKGAAKSKHPAPSVVKRLPDGTKNPSRKFYIVDEYIQKKYANGLAALGVREMTEAEYETFLMDSQWLMDLPDKIYVQLLAFFALEMKVFDSRKASVTHLKKAKFLLLKEKFLSWDETVQLQRVGTVGRVSVVDHMGSLKCRYKYDIVGQRTVLLPPKLSKWPLLFSLSPGYARRFIALSDSYLVPVCPPAVNIVTSSPGEGSMLEFIKQSFDAVDLPAVRVPVCEHFPFLQPMDLEKSLLIMQWLKQFLPTRRTTKMENENDVFLTDLKSLDWVKTLHDGWQRPTSVFFFNSSFEKYFTALDLPFLDGSAYDPLGLNDLEAQFVFKELGVITDAAKGSASVAKYFSTCPADELDHKIVSRLYAYLSAVGWCDDDCGLEIWIPASDASTLPTWREPVECVISDRGGIFEESGRVAVLDKFYDSNLLPFFSGVLHVPEEASVGLYCEIWLKWSDTARKALDGLANEDNCLDASNDVLDEGDCSLLMPSSFRRDKVQHIFEKVLQRNWQESDEEEWLSFQLKAFLSLENSELSRSFQRAAKGKLNFAWLLPNLSPEELDRLVKLYSKMGVRKLSEHVKCDVRVPPNVWSKQVPRGEGLIKEGFLRSVLAYLCNTARNHDLWLADRQKIMSQLISATEIVVSDPFEISYSLDAEMLQFSSATVVRNAFAYYDQENGKLYYINNDHPLVQADLSKMAFNSQFANTISTSIFFPEHPELVAGLTMLLKLLCDSGFAMKAVAYELHAQNLVIFPEDEKLLMENMATRKPV
ncbi:unnamed protein product [Calypogeia fissa]